MRKIEPESDETIISNYDKLQGLRPHDKVQIDVSLLTNLLTEIRISRSWEGGWYRSRYRNLNETFLWDGNIGKGVSPKCPLPIELYDSIKSLTKCPVDSRDFQIKLIEVFEEFWANIFVKINETK